MHPLLYLYFHSLYISDLSDLFTQPQLQPFHSLYISDISDLFTQPQLRPFHPLYISDLSDLSDIFAQPQFRLFRLYRALCTPLTPSPDYFRHDSLTTMTPA